MGVPEREDREQRIKNQFEIIITENFPNLVKEIDIQVQKTERIQKKDEPKETHT